MAFDESSRQVCWPTVCLLSDPFRPLPCSTPFCKELHCPSLCALWLPVGLAQRTTWNIKGEKRGETKIFFFLCFLRYLLQGSSSMPRFQLSSGRLVMRLAPRDGSSFWVLVTPLSYSLKGVDGFLLRQFLGCLTRACSDSPFCYHCVISYLKALHLRDPE